MAPEKRSWLEIYVTPSLSPEASTAHLDYMLRTRVPAGVVQESKLGVSLPKVNGLGQHEVLCADSRLAQVTCEIIFESGFAVSRIVELPKGKEVAIPEINSDLALNFS